MNFGLSHYSLFKTIDFLKEWIYTAIEWFRHSLYNLFNRSDCLNQLGRFLIKYGLRWECIFVRKIYKYMKKLREGHTPAEVAKRIIAGEEKTTSEWAKEFRVDRGQMSSIFVELRKKGYPFYPIGTQRSFTGESKEGIIKNILESKKFYREASRNYLKDKLQAHIHGMFMLLENTLIEYPEIFIEAESAWNSVMIDVLTKKEQLKLDRPTYANNSSSDKQIKSRSKSTKKVV